MSTSSLFPEDAAQPVHVNIAEAPGALLSPDAPDQTDVLRHLYEDSEDIDELRNEANRFLETTSLLKNLKDMQRIYDRKQTAISLDLLKHRVKVNWRDSSLVLWPHRVGNMAKWDIPSHFIDMLVVVSRGIGLGALLPNLCSDFDWEFKLDVSKNHSREFTMVHAKLGFNPSRRMLWVGTTSMSEDVWIAMVPSTFETHAAPMLEELEVQGSKKRYTHLEDRHRKILLMFLAHVLQSIGFRHISVTSTYPDLDDDENFNLATTLFGSTTGRLSQALPLLIKLSKAQELHDQISTSYMPWLAAAPPSYTDDGFFMNSVPIAITSRCGQNQNICSKIQGPQYDQEIFSWNRRCDFSQVKVAIADEIEPRSNDAIFEKSRGNVWDGFDKDHREKLSPEDLDELSENARIFTEKGVEIPRVYHRFDGGGAQQKPCGVLVDLNNLHTLFQPDDRLLYARAGPHPKNYFPYPQAGLVTAGHLQADALISDFYPRLEAINLDVLKNDEEDFLEDQLIEAPKWPVYGVSCQMYNAVMHHTRGIGSQHHDVVRGTVSGALGGQCTAEAASTKQAIDLHRACRAQMPHEAYKVKASNDAVCKDLRLENVYWVDFDQIAAENRTGSYLYRNIIQRLAGAWRHSTLMDRLKDNTVLFKPEAFPAVYNWMTYPLTVLLEDIWKAGSWAEGSPSVKTVELCSVVERALNYMHTGNTAVLLTRIMNPLWTSQGLLNDGWPCFNSRLVSFGNRQQAEWRIKWWPFDVSTRKPTSAAYASQAFYHGAGHAGTYLALLAVEMASTKSMVLPCMPAGNQTLQDILAHLLVEMFIGDVTSLVKKAFLSDIEARCHDDDQEVEREAKRQKQALTEWLKLKHPLSKEETATLWTRTRQQRRKQEKLTSWGLLFAITRKQANISLDSYTTAELGEKLVDMTKAGLSRRVKAPLIHGGLLHHALPVAQDRLARQSILTQTDAEKALGEALGRALSARKVEIVPYHRAAAGQSHWLAADPRWWLNVNLPLQPARVLREELSAEEEDTLAEAKRSPTTPWNLAKSPLHIKWFLHKVNLPEEWTLKAASVRQNNGNSLVYSSYSYVQRSYDGRKPLHRMALLWSIMYSWMLPQVGTPPDLNLKQTDSPRIATFEVLSIPWITLKRKGFTAPLPFVVMLTCIIISFFDPLSPLRINLAATDNELGSEWTKKHAPKFLSAVTLIRMNLAIAKKSGVGGSLRFGGNWALKDVSVVEALYHRVVEALNGESSLALNNAYSLIYGEEVAKRVARYRSFAAPLS